MQLSRKREKDTKSPRRSNGRISLTQDSTMPTDDDPDVDSLFSPDSWLFTLNEDSNNNNENKEKRPTINAPPQLTDAKTVRRVYALARDVTSALDALGVHYWTSGGTTLGAVRHGGLIPWDDDVDICIRLGNFGKNERF